MGNQAWNSNAADVHWVGGQGDYFPRLTRAIGQHRAVRTVRCQLPVSAHAALMNAHAILMNSGAVGGDAVVAQRVAQRRTQIQPRAHFIYLDCAALVVSHRAPQRDFEQAVVLGVG